MQTLNSPFSVRIAPPVLSAEAAASTRSLPEHLAEIPGTPWAFWRWICLRSAGFPAQLITRLAATECAAAADNLLQCEAEAEKERQIALAGVRALLDLTHDEECRSSLLRDLKQLNKPGDRKGEADSLHQRYREVCSSAKDAAAAFMAEFQRAIERTSTHLEEIAGDPRFLQAVLLQNRRAVHSGISVMLRHRAAGKKRGKKERQQEELIANYLQRYAVKNDSIGFFGPVGWARIVSEKKDLAVRPGSSLIAQSDLFFENWCIETLANRIAADSPLYPWMAPRMLPFCHVRNQKLYFLGKITALPLAHALLLQRCDGSRIAKDIAAELVAIPNSGIRSHEEVYRLLRIFQARRIIVWKYEIPVCLHPERHLRTLLEHIENDGLRIPALNLLDQLEQAKDNVERALGNPDMLNQALENLDLTFTQLTKAAPTRSAGAMYAARTLIYQDCRRNVDVEIPPQLVKKLGAPLSLLLTSARWFSHRAAAILREKLQQTYKELQQKNGAQPVTLLQLWAKAEGLIFAVGERPFEGITQELQSYWRHILNLPEGQKQVVYKVEDLRTMVEACFAVPCPGWRLARYNSPDIMIAASSPKAIDRGDFLFVLGEMHVTTHTVRYSFALSQHPEPHALFQAITADLSEGEVLPVPPKHWPRATNRTAIALTPPKTHYLEIAEEPISNGTRSRALPIASLLVFDSDKGLTVQTCDGRLKFDLIDFIGEALSNVAVDMLKIVPPGRHIPRITVDQLVITRETWTFLAEELPLVHAESEHERFLGARKWMHACGIPRFVFVKAPIEVKPFYLDFDSPVYVEIFAKLVRRMAVSHRSKDRITVSEMLPTPDQLWLSDIEGNTYTSELRMVVRDLAADRNAEDRTDEATEAAYAET